MLLSVIIPVYNVVLYLQRCLDSVAAQKVEDMEVIVVDDGSTDGSSEFARKYCEEHEKFRYIYKENGGLMSAWTTGVRASVGDYIGFIDSDDAAADDMYKKMLEKAYETDADIILCSTLINNVKHTSRISSGFYYGEEWDNMKTCVFPIPHSKSISTSRCNKLFRRKIITENLIYTESLSRTFEDRYILPAAIYSSKSLYYIDEPLYIYTPDRKGSNSKLYKKNLLEEIKRFYQVQYNILKDKGFLVKNEIAWEKVFIDYIRLYVSRNIIGISSFLTRYKSSKDLLYDPLVKDRLEKYADLCTSRLEKVVLLSYKMKSPLLLTICSYLAH